MKTNHLPTDEIRYDAADQTFNAVVSISTEFGDLRYACSVAAPLTMSISQASAALRREALRRHCQAPELYSAPATAPLSIAA